MNEGAEQVESKENEPKQIIVEIGPGDRPMIWRMGRDRNNKAAYYKAKGESLFSVRSGDTFIAVDLPPDKSVDVWRRHSRHSENWKPEDGRLKSHLNSIEGHLKNFLPEGAKGKVVHADGQRLPFADSCIDVLFMANVMGGHVQDDFGIIGGRRASGKRILREKQNLIKEAKRVLKVDGKLIIEEEYAPAESVAAAREKIFKDFESDTDFSLRDLYDPENGLLVLELTKRVPTETPKNR